MPTKIEKDAYSGVETTGHEWDGIKELNTPLPKWWLMVFYATIVWSAAWFLLYPSIPYGTGYWHGLLGYSQRRDAMAGVAAMHAQHAAAMEQIARTPITDIPKNPKLMEVALVAGRITFANNCQPCHGQNGAGRPGYPALGDDVWLWGGKPTDIETTITHGVRSGDPAARDSQMPSFGTDGILKPEQIQQVADFVGQWWGVVPASKDTRAGAKIYADNCAMCHGDKGQGNRDVGAPPLNSHVHLYEGTRDAIVAQVTHPRHGVMPAWNRRLDPATIRSVALYVHSLGGGE
jgi:cytochrome c oxidase cbb3-type subunit 3